MTYDENGVRALLLREIKRAGGITAWCNGPRRPKPSYVQAFLYRAGRPGPKILDALGLDKVVGYRRQKIAII